MSNATNRVEAALSRPARLQLVGVFCGLVVLALALPAPIAALTVCFGGAGTAGPGATGTVDTAVPDPAVLEPAVPDTAVLDTAVLAAASLLVWALLIWATGSLVLAGLARLPGWCGRLAGATLQKVTPVAMRRLLIAGVGVSLLAGTAGCGGDQSASVGSGPNTIAVPVAAAAAPMRAATEVARAGGVPGPGTVARGVPSPAPELGSPAAGRANPAGQADPANQTDRIDLDWPVLRPGSEPHAPAVDLDWPTAQAQQPAAKKPTAAKATAPTATVARASVAKPAASKPAATEVIVRPGDTLWSLAADQLTAAGPVTDVRIDATWRAWYAINRAVIGADPDLILPGQQLAPPSENPPSASTNGDTR